MREYIYRIARPSEGEMLRGSLKLRERPLGQGFGT